METGVVSEENFQTVLRQIGQKRRQGVLELVHGDHRVEIHFIQGKAVEAVIVGSSPVISVLEVLQRAGRVSNNFKWSLANDPELQTYRALLLSLAQEAVVIEEELYRRVIRQQVLDRIYSFPINERAEFTFRTQMVAADREFSPTISVGQLLLDIVALPQDEERFGKIFTTETWLGRSEVPEGVLTAEERVLYDCLDEPLQCVTLELRSMLSHFHFIDALLALHERGLVTVRDASPVSPSNLSIKNMVHRTVVSTVEASSLVQSFGEIAIEQKVEPQLATRKPLVTEEQAESTVNSAGAAVMVKKPANRRERWSLRALESAAVVQLVAILYLLVAFAVPWLSWTEALAFFSQ